MSLSKNFLGALCVILAAACVIHAAQAPPPASTGRHGPARR